MSYRQSTFDSYPNSNYPDDDMDEAHLPSFEVIQGGMRQEQIYSRTDDRPTATGWETRETQPEPDLRPDCQKYLKMILNDVGKDDGERQPMNILVIGPPGVGKSSFICSLAAAFSQERWREYAYIGSYGDEGEPITVFLDTFEKCAMERIRENADKYADNLLPTLIDVAGVENENSELWKELLKIVFFGRLPKGEALYSAYKYGVKDGVEGLREKYTNYDEILKVDRIIFLASATEEVPINLIQCVRSAARPGGDDTNKRAIPLFGVMTKVDRVAKDGKEGDVSQKVFEDRQKRFIRALGLLGATNRYIATYNYCDDTDEEKNRLTSVMPEIDAPLLKFMTQVCDPAIQVMNPEFTFTGENVATESQSDVRKRRRPQETEQNMQNEKTELKSQVTKLSVSNLCPKIVLVFIIIALVFAILFMFV